MSGRLPHRRHLAYEVACRVAAPVGMELAHQGWNNTGTCCPPGIHRGRRKMLGLTSGQMGHSSWDSANWSSGLQAVQVRLHGEADRPVQILRGAIIGALLAQKGFTGIEDVFENKFGGFYNCFTDDVYDVERTSGGPGEAGGSSWG
ncbi:hypothetical protein MASR2M17_08980 [Aminivibrio sp.]